MEKRTIENGHNSTIWDANRGKAHRIAGDLDGTKATLVLPEGPFVHFIRSMQGKIARALKQVSRRRENAAFDQKAMDTMKGEGPVPTPVKPVEGPKAS